MLLRMEKVGEGKDLIMGQRFEALIEETLIKIELAMNQEWVIFKKMLKNLFRLEESWRVTSKISTPLTPAKIRTSSSMVWNNIVTTPQAPTSITGGNSLYDTIPFDLSLWDNELEKFQNHSEKHARENIVDEKVYTDSSIMK